MEPSPALSCLLLLADGRLPTGAHAHSAGIEAAVADGSVAGVDDLTGFLAGRLHTVGRSDAALAAATAIHVDAHGTDMLKTLDAEATARLPVAAMRNASRRLGRQLSRVAASCWPDTRLLMLHDGFATGLHQVVALGLVGCVIGIEPEQVALLAVHQTITTPAQAAVRLLGLDPYAVAAVTAALAPTQTLVAHEATKTAHGPLCDLPARCGPLADLRAIDHHTWHARLFST